MIIERLQDSIRTHGFDGWLFFDHHRRDPLAYRVLGLPDGIMTTRRWYYFIPAQGTPRKLVHQIESHVLDQLPGTHEVYSSWADQQTRLNGLVTGSKKICMQYSPDCAIPYISLVDAGTIELVRKIGVEVLSSANLVQEFEARWSDEQFNSHIEAGRRVDRVRKEAFDLISHRLQSNDPVTEYQVQQFIRERFSAGDLFTDHGPIVAVNSNASDPHYEPSQARSALIQQGDLVLIDMWAKLNRPETVYYDITWTGYCGEVAPDLIQNVFQIVKNARRCASEFVIGRVFTGQPVAGFEVDNAARNYIAGQGHGPAFFHRTGHSIGTEVHGSGANMDNLECHDDRPVIANTGFSIEPGVYLADFGIRSEVNVYVGQRTAQVTGEEQDELVRI